MERKKTNNVKENKKIKKVNIKVDKSVDDGNEIKAFILIILIIAALIGAIYVLTELFNKDSDQKTITSGEINYEVTTVGTILNRPYDEYYVMVYNQDDDNSPVYSAILAKYMEKSSSKDYVKMFYCDLDNILNNSYYNVNDDNKSNPKATKLEEFDFGDITLLKVKKGKITKYIEDLEKIKEILK